MVNRMINFLTPEDLEHLEEDMRKLSEGMDNLFPAMDKAENAPR